MIERSDAERRIVVVVGFHRSGTSMVTRMLNLLGVDLGDESALLPPEERDNARGYWEPRWMIDLNEELLATLGSGTFAAFDPEPGWERSPQLEPLRERARRSLAEHFGESRLWGWKDPRTSLTLPFWRTVVEEPITCVICVRSPADAVASALKRGVVDLHRWSYAERWADYTSEALSNTGEEERLLVFYEDALRAPADETRRLAAFLGIDEPHPARLQASVGSVDPELRHHTTSPLDVAVDPGLPVETRALYLMLRAHRDLERGSQPTRGLLTALERVGVELGRLRREHAAVVQERDRAKLALDAAAAAADATELERVRLGEQAEQLAQELRDRDAAAAARETEAARRHAEETAARDAAILARDARIAALESTVEELSGVVRARDAQLEAYARSLSWRITAPLRAAMRRVRGARA